MPAPAQRACRRALTPAALWRPATRCRCAQVVAYHPGSQSTQDVANTLLTLGVGNVSVPKRCVQLPRATRTTGTVALACLRAPPPPVPPHALAHARGRRACALPPVASKHPPALPCSLHPIPPPPPAPRPPLPRPPRVRACSLPAGATWEGELVLRWFNRYWKRPTFEVDMPPMPGLRRQVRLPVARRGLPACCARSRACHMALQRPPPAPSIIPALGVATHPRAPLRCICTAPGFRVGGRGWDGIEQRRR